MNPDGRLSRPCGCGAVSKSRQVDSLGYGRSSMTGNFYHILTGEGCGCAIDRADPFIDRLVTFVEDRNKSRGSWRHVREICVLFIELQAAHSPGYRCGIGTGYTDHRNSALSASCRDRRYGAA